MDGYGDFDISVAFARKHGGQFWGVFKSVLFTSAMLCREFCM